MAAETPGVSLNPQPTSWDALTSAHKKALEELKKAQQEQIEAYRKEHGLLDSSRKRIDAVLREEGLEAVSLYLDEVVMSELQDKELPFDLYEEFRPFVLRIHPTSKFYDRVQTAWTSFGERKKAAEEAAIVAAKEAEEAAEKAKAAMEKARAEAAADPANASLLDEIDDPLASLAAETSTEPVVEEKVAVASGKGKGRR